jgi:hypothetical protein
MTIRTSIISSGARTSKCRKVIDNWYIPKLELLQSVTSNIYVRAEQQYNGLQIRQSDTTSPKSKIPQIAVTTRVTRLRSAVILLAEKDVDSLTSPLPFAKPMLMFQALTITTRPTG